MKLSNSLLHAITLSVSLSAIATTTSCEKEKMNQTQIDHLEEPERNQNSEPCPACGMG